MIELKPIVERTTEYEDIEKAIQELFKKEIYLPLLKQFQIKASTLKNSREDLIEAIRSGRLTFNKGKFSGKLNATLSKELRELGAKWDRLQKCYSLPIKEIPLDIRQVISASEYKFEQKISDIDRRLSEVSPNELASKLKISKMFDKTLWRVEKEFQKSVQAVTVAPQLTPAQAQRISDEWENNMKLWIKDFTEKEIKSLRAKMKESILAGNRYEHAVKSIQESYGVSARKAKFLARQETALMMTKFKQVRYQDSGINEYKWKCVLGTPAHPVRPMHKELNDRSAKGEIFRFDAPPVDDPNGSRHNPGENYNCRCRAIPVVRFK